MDINVFLNNSQELNKMVSDVQKQLRLLIKDVRPDNLDRRLDGIRKVYYTLNDTLVPMAQRSLGLPEDKKSK